MDNGYQGLWDWSYTNWADSTDGADCVAAAADRVN